MFSPRRMRLLILAAVGIFVFLLFYSGFSSDGSSEVAQDFYHKTKEAMNNGAGPGQAVLDSETGRKAGHIPADKDADGDVDEDDKAAGIEMQERLKEAEQKAKSNANNKGGMRPDPPSKVIGAGNSAEGQDKDKVQKAGSNDVAKSKEEKAEENSQALAAESSLKAILEKAPVVIFSKSYCPFSKRAKGLLLEKYIITPEPYVVELDEHPIGSAIQDALQEKTGRRTVPNIMINGVSIGGADDIVAMDNDDKLLGKIRDLGKTRVEIVERFVSKGAKN